MQDDPAVVLPGSRLSGNIASRHIVFKNVISIYFLDLCHHTPGEKIKIKLSSVYVDDQDKALRFYTDILGSVRKNEIPKGDFCWLTVTSSEEPEGTELVPGPGVNEPVAVLKRRFLIKGFH